MWADEGGWQAVSGQPPTGPDGTTAYRLFVRLVHEDAADGSRWASCTGWLEAAPDGYLTAEGEVVVRLLQGDREVSTSRLGVERRIEPGSRSGGLDLPDYVLMPPDGAVVTCAITFTAS